MLNGTLNPKKIQSLKHETNMNGSCSVAAATVTSVSECNGKKTSKAQIHNDSLDQLGELLLYLSGYYLLLGIFQWLELVYRTIFRDLTGLFRLVLTKYYLHRFWRQNATVPKLFAETVQKYGKRVAFYYEDQQWTFEQLHEYSNRVANVFLELGYKRGDEVALMMPSKPEYVGIWLGMAKAGIVTALINYNQRQGTLAHSINLIKTKALIFDQELEQQVIEASPLFSNKELSYFHVGPLNSHEILAKDLNALMRQASPEQPDTVESGQFTDNLFYIFTSGTTGMPKAAIIKNCRYLYFGTGVRNLFALYKPEIIYTCIPLYHLAGGGIGTSLSVIFGSSMVIKRKFSATSFWRDCARYNCTVAQYIGELCRYLLAQPPSVHDTQHKLKLMFGNGLRPDIWNEFVRRFEIPNMGEFYGSTEGNANVVNFSNQPGACGFISQILPPSLTDLFYPVSLVQVDEHTGIPLRDANGYCVRCRPGNFGEFVGRIAKKDATRAFDGYATDQDASARKILRNVYRKDDAYFSSGDLLYLDHYGWTYFKERTGDTFRWKGENVSTLQVESVVYTIVQCSDCVVYGVEVPGCEGKAGMLAIGGLCGELDLRELAQQLKRSLDSYAWPMFIRLTHRIETTSTMKISKVKLQKEGFRPVDHSEDQLYFWNRTANEYQSLTKSIYEKILRGEINF